MEILSNFPEAFNEFDAFVALIDDAVVGARRVINRFGCFWISGNTDPIIWNFSDSVLSSSRELWIWYHAELAAKPPLIILETVASLAEVVEFDHINFRSSPADDYLSVEGVGDGHFAYDRVDGVHFGSDVLVGEAGHLMILPGTTTIMVKE